MQMAKFTARGMDAYITQLNDIYTDVTPIINHAVYEGAKIIADEVTDMIRGIPEARMQSNGLVWGISKSQKKGLLEGFGISHMIVDDYNLRYVRLGFAGYNDTATDKYRRGQPNAMIARAVISGTSFREKNDFMAHALRYVRQRANKTIEDVFELELSKVIK